MNKTIGIVGWSTGESSFGTSKSYLEYLKHFGQVVILGPNTFIPSLDLVVLPGGKDVINGGNGDFSFFNSDGERFLEHFDANTLPKYIESKTPIFGICRGFQALMKNAGVPLIQDINWDHGDSKDERDTSKNKLAYNHQTPYGRRNDSYIPPTSCGSWHHQGVTVSGFESTPACNDWDIIAYSPLDFKGYADDKDYQMVEYIKHKHLPIAATQSHPERNYNTLEDRLIRELLNTY